MAKFSVSNKSEKKEKEKRKMRGVREGLYFCYHMCFIPLLCIKAPHKRIQATGKSIGVSNRRYTHAERERERERSEGDSDTRKQREGKKIFPKKERRGGGGGGGWGRRGKI